MRPRLQRQRNATRHRHVEGGLARGVQPELALTAMAVTVIPGGMIGVHHRTEGVHLLPGALRMRPLSVGFHFFFS